MLQLLARIERMERRVQLVKKDSEREKHRIFQGFEVDEKPEAETCEKLPLECPQELLEPPPTLQPKHFPYGRNGKGHKRYRVPGGLWGESRGTFPMASPSICGPGAAQGVKVPTHLSAAWHWERIPLSTEWRELHETLGGDP